MFNELGQADVDEGYTSVGTKDGVILKQGEASDTGI